MDAGSGHPRHPPLRAARAWPRRATRLIAVAAPAAALVMTCTADAREPYSEDAAKAEPRAHDGATRPPAAHHHRKEIGIASFYARRFGGRKMADGTRLDLNDHVAASRTLPLGTEALVTNLETGLSTRVTIQDRGPYVKNRILDLTPAAAETIGLTRKQGLVKVEVQPLSVPPPKDDRKD